MQAAILGMDSLEKLRVCIHRKPPMDHQHNQLTTLRGAHRSKPKHYNKCSPRSSHNLKRSRIERCWPLKQRYAPENPPMQEVIQEQNAHRKDHKTFPEPLELARASRMQEGREKTIFYRFLPRKSGDRGGCVLTRYPRPKRRSAN